MTHRKIKVIMNIAVGGGEKCQVESRERNLLVFIHCGTWGLLPHYRFHRNLALVWNSGLLSEYLKPCV